MMKLCEKNHGLIVWDTSDVAECPACVLFDEREEERDNVIRLESELADALLKLLKEPKP